MNCFVLQDFITLRSSLSPGFIIQSPDRWLDAERYQDVVIWADVRDSSSGAAAPQLFVGTSPTRDASSLVTLALVDTSTLTNGVGVVVKPVTRASGGINGLKVARWVLWTVGAGAAPWEITFRIHVAVNAPGGN